MAGSFYGNFFWFLFFHLQCYIATTIKKLFLAFVGYIWSILIIYKRNYVIKFCSYLFTSMNTNCSERAAIMTRLCFWCTLATLAIFGLISFIKVFNSRSSIDGVTVQLKHC